MGIFYPRGSYFTMNISMSHHFFPIIIISRRKLLCSSIMKILLTLVVSSRLWLIIRWIMFSTRLPINIWFPFTKAMCLWNFYIYANWWKSSTDFWPSTDNFKFFIFNSWFLPCSVIFLKYYDALLNEIFVVVVLVGHP